MIWTDIVKLAIWLFVIYIIYKSGIYKWVYNVIDNKVYKPLNSLYDRNGDFQKTKTKKSRFLKKLNKQINSSGEV